MDGSELNGFNLSRYGDKQLPCVDIFVCTARGPALGAAEPGGLRRALGHGVQLPSRQAERLPLRRRLLGPHVLRSVGGVPVRQALAAVLPETRRRAEVTGCILLGDDR